MLLLHNGKPPAPLKMPSRRGRTVAARSSYPPPRPLELIVELPMPDSVLRVEVLRRPVLPFGSGVREEASRLVIVEDRYAL